MIDDQLLVGIVLIAAGVAIGLLAYALVLNRREAGQGEPAIEEVAELKTGEPEETSVEAEQVETGTPVEELVPAHVAPGQEPPTEAPEEPILGRPSTPAGAPEHGPAGRRPIATLLRDNRTGKLTLMVGDREYVNPSELKGTNDWFSVEEASRDLADWLSDAQSLEARVKRPAPRTKSLVDEVNEILEQKLAESGLTHRGVRLNEDRDGSVRVYVGLQAYTLDEVPDPEIREVIRLAVAEWEGRK
jgi:hypothetical protein